MRDFFVSPPAKAMLQLNQYAEREYGYASLATVNAKNSFGGYVGKRPYVAFYHNGILSQVIRAEYVSTKTGYWGAFGKGKHLLYLVDEEEWLAAKQAASVDSMK